MEHVREIQRAVMLASQSIKPIEVRVAKHHHSGMSKKDIAKRISKSQAWISKTLTTPGVVKLKALLCYYQESLDGPKEAQRVAMLWRIACTNEEDKPSVAIAAIAEMNRMSNLLGVGEVPAVHITINQEVMPKGILDA
jgi:hypothetical protein